MPQDGRTGSAEVLAYSRLEGGCQLLCKVKNERYMASGRILWIESRQDSRSGDRLPCNCGRRRSRTPEGTSSSRPELANRSTSTRPEVGHVKGLPFARWRLDRHCFWVADHTSHPNGSGK